MAASRDEACRARLGAASYEDSYRSMPDDPGDGQDWTPLGESDAGGQWHPAMLEERIGAWRPSRSLGRRV